MNVLLVDDDADTLTITRALLERRGHAVTALSSPFGVTGHVSGFKGTRPDVVILDYMMPGLSGERLIEMWAADPTTRAVPVILYSNAATDLLERAAARHPRCAVVQKGSGTRVLEDAMQATVALPRT